MTLALLPEQFKQEPSFDHRTGSDGDGYYIRTFTGAKLYWAKVEHFPYNIEDIAHALAMKCRWSGHTKKFYSIAQHSIHVSWNVPRPLRLAALLHDGAEFCMPDFASPLKWYLASEGFTQLKELERKVQSGIHRRFGIGELTLEEKQIIKKADTLALATESRDLMPPGSEQEWMGAPDEGELIPVGPRAAKELFLNRYWEIVGTTPIGKYEDIA